MKIGDLVSVLDDALSGTVISMVNDNVLIKMDDGFEMEFSKNELVVEKEGVLQKGSDYNSISKAISEKEEKKPIKIKKVRQKERNLPAMEVDLHVNKLTNNFKRMSNYDMLNLQLDTAKRQLDFAISKKIQKMVFIHGVGAGVLKSELEFMFNRYEGLKFYEADYQKYGQGAMEVYLFQKKQ